MKDEETGLYYYNARYYDAELGRFIQPDTIVPAPGNPQTLNRYSYVYNNPLKYSDPTGHAGVSTSWSPGGYSAPSNPYWQPWQQQQMNAMWDRRWDGIINSSRQNSYWLEDAQARANSLMPGLSLGQQWNLDWRGTLYDSTFSALNTVSLGVANSLAIALGGSDLWGQGSYSGQERLFEGALVPGVARGNHRGRRRDEPVVAVGLVFVMLDQVAVAVGHHRGGAQVVGVIVIKLGRTGRREGGGSRADRGKNQTDQEPSLNERGSPKVSWRSHARIYSAE